MLLYHYRYEWPSLFPKELCLGHGAMPLFFVLSGFLITLSMLKTFPVFGSPLGLTDRIRLGSAAARAFYLRRIYRVGPAAVFWVIFPILLSLLPSAQLVFERTSLFIRDGIVALSMQASYQVVDAPTMLGVYWSLSVEEHFYVLIPLLFLAFPTVRQRAAFVLAIVFLVAFILRPLQEPVAGAWGAEAFRFMSHTQFDSVGVGVLLAFLHWKKISFLPVPKRPGLVSLAAVVFCFSILWISPVYMHIWALQRIGFITFWIASGYLCYLASFNRGYVLEIPFVRGLLETVGKRALSVYLCHFPAMKLSKLIFLYLGRTNSPRFEVLVGTLLMVAFAELSYRLLEVPFMEKGRRATREILTASDDVPGGPRRLAS